MRGILVGALAVALSGAPLTIAYAQGGLKDNLQTQKMKGQGNGLGDYEASNPKGKGKDKGGDTEGPNEAPAEPEFTPCAMSDIGLTTGACYGWTEGNFNSGNAGDKSFSATVLNTLTSTTTFTGPSLTWLENLGSISGNTVNFATTLYGDTIVAFHVGGANGQATGVGYQATAWYRFDAGSTGIDVLAFNRAGLSNARLYRTQGPPCLTCNAIPEPSSWALMILGFGAVGAVLRSRRWSLA